MKIDIPMSAVLEMCSDLCCYEDDKYLDMTVDVPSDFHALLCYDDEHREAELVFDEQTAELCGRDMIELELSEDDLACLHERYEAAPERERRMIEAWMAGAQAQKA